MNSHADQAPGAHTQMIQEPPAILVADRQAGKDALMEPRLQGDANESRRMRVALVSLYSEQYPSIGESHGLSAVAGAVANGPRRSRLDVSVIDMVAWGVEDGQRLVDELSLLKPDVLGLAMQYGTYSFLSEYWQQLQSTLESGGLVVLGGPLASYLADDLLNTFAAEAVIVVGEGEDALASLVSMRLEGENDLSGIPGIMYNKEGRPTANPRQLFDLSSALPPYREHLREIVDAGGQVYIETSRGCSWSACTFCLRGLTDLNGRSHEYRRKTPSQVRSEVSTLRELGVIQATLADEDFLGGPLAEVEEFVQQTFGGLPTGLHLDASLTISSVFSANESSTDDLRRLRVLEKLHRSGLRKVFLGIESCSPTQLKRYAKGHTPEEAAEAARRLRTLGIRVEIGVILFDPLCTLGEISASLSFMRDHELASVASGLSSELRLQANTPYLRILEATERRIGRKLHSPRLDPNTMSYSYEFLDPEVGHLHRVVGDWNQRLHPLYYPAKSISRFGDSGAIGPPVLEIRDATARFRESICDCILGWIATESRDEANDQRLGAGFAAAAQELAASLKRSLPGDSPGAEHPVVARALQAAAEVESLFP